MPSSGVTSTPQVAERARYRRHASGSGRLWNRGRISAATTERYPLAHVRGHTPRGRLSRQAPLGGITCTPLPEIGPSRPPESYRAPRGPDELCGLRSRSIDSCRRLYSLRSSRLSASTAFDWSPARRAYRGRCTTDVGGRIPLLRLLPSPSGRLLGVRGMATPGIRERAAFVAGREGLAESRTALIVS